MLDWNRALGVIVHGHVFADQKKKPVHGRLVRADCFCTIATSSTALCFDAVVLQAALVVGSFPLAKIALGYRPYVPAARLIAILAFGLVAVLVGVPYFR